LFCDIDDFYQEFVPTWEWELLASGARQSRRAGQPYASEIMTIRVHFHQVRFRDFKTYYPHYVAQHLCREFPNLVSNSRLL
jgi:hypothetical protein